LDFAPGGWPSVVARTGVEPFARVHAHELMGLRERAGEKTYV